MAGNLLKREFSDRILTWFRPINRNGLAAYAWLTKRERFSGFKQICLNYKIHPD